MFFIKNYIRADKCLHFGVKTHTSSARIWVSSLPPYCYAGASWEATKDTYWVHKDLIFSLFPVVVTILILVL